MSTLLSSLRRSGRAALVALALGAVSFTGMPAMAASPSFSIEFGFSGGGGDFRFHAGDRHHHKHRRCLTNHEVRRGLRDEGFRDIRFHDRRGNTVTVRAEKRRWVYHLAVQRCSGKVTILDRDRRGRGRGHGGFGLHFRF